MSISSRIENMYDNVDKAYKSIADLGIDLTNVDKNLENLSTKIDEIYDSLPKVENETASESVTLTPTRKAQMTLDLLGNTQQDSTTGKNLANIYAIASLTVEAFKRVVADDKIVISDNTNTSGFMTTERKLSQICPNLQVGDSATLTFTTTFTANYIYLNGYNQVWNNGATKTITQEMLDSVVIMYGGYNQTSTISEFMFRLSSITDATYEPYTNGASPNPDYPQEIHNVSGDNTIKVEGKNLCYNSTLGSNAQNLLFYVKNKNLQKTFTLSFTSNVALTNNSLYLRIDGVDKGRIDTLTTDSNNKVSKVVTLTDALYQEVLDGNEVFFQAYKSGATFTIPNDYMIYNGSTATTYEPYTSQSHLISLGDIELNKIGTYQDKIYKDNGKWYLHKEIGKDIISSGMLLYGNYGVDNKPLYYCDSETNHLANMGICNKFTKYVVDQYNPTQMPNNNFRTQTSNSKRYYFRYDSIASLQAFNDEIANNPLEIYYVLLTPTNTEITDSTLLETLENIYSMTGTTSITQENNDLAMFIKAKALRGE